MYDQEWDSQDEYYEPEQQEVDPRLANALAFSEAQQAEAQQRGAEEAYDSEMNRVISQNPGIDPEDLHTFVVTADGDFDQAVLLRNAYVERWNARYAPAVPEEAPKPTSIHGAVDQLVVNLRQNRR